MAGLILKSDAERDRVRFTPTIPLSWDGSANFLLRRAHENYQRGRLTRVDRHQDGMPRHRVRSGVSPITSGANDPLQYSFLKETLTNQATKRD